LEHFDVPFGHSSSRKVRKMRLYTNEFGARFVGMTQNVRKHLRKISRIAVLEGVSMETDSFDEAPATRDNGNTTASESFEGDDPKRFFPPRRDDKETLFIQRLRDHRRSEGARELGLAIEPPCSNHTFELRPFLAFSDNCRARGEPLRAELNEGVEECIAPFVGYEAAEKCERAGAR